MLVVRDLEGQTLLRSCTAEKEVTNSDAICCKLAP